MPSSSSTAWLDASAMIISASVASFGCSAALSFGVCVSVVIVPSMSAFSAFRSGAGLRRLVGGAGAGDRGEPRPEAAAHVGAQALDRIAPKLRRLPGDGLRPGRVSSALHDQLADHLPGRGE